MKGKEALFLTVKISLIAQILTFIIQLRGFFIKLDPRDLVLKDVLIMETVVQLIEGAWYIWIAYALKGLKNDTIAGRRYMDWVITTPVMLIQTVLLMAFFAQNKDLFSNKKDEEKPVLTTGDFILKHKDTLIKIVLFNFIMLAFGYLAETKLLNKSVAIPAGFLFFFLSFREIWDKFANKTTKGKNLFYGMAGIWSLYGVAAGFDVITKNVMYNILDIISKNFYGLYVLYEILNVSEKRKIKSSFKNKKKRSSKSDKLSKDGLNNVNYFESLLS